MPITRRDFADFCLRAAALPAFAAWFNAAPLDAAAIPYQPQFFSPDDFAALQAFTEILIPTDETPGAREARCAQFIDFLLHASGDDAVTQANWRKTLITLRDLGFHAGTAEARAQLVADLAQQNHPAFKLIKPLNAFAFYTSRPGQIETLDYRGNSYNLAFPACTHPEHRIL